MLTALTNYVANDTVANSRKNPLETLRRLEKRHDPTTEGRKRNLLRAIMSPERFSVKNSKQDRTMEILRVATREKTKDTSDDEIESAGLEVRGGEVWFENLRLQAV